MLKRTEIRITFFYLLFGVLWILFSDKAILQIASTPSQLTEIQTYKGWFYVAITATLLFFLLQQAARRQRKMLGDLKKSQQELKINQQNYRHVLQNAFEGILVSRKGKNLFFNKELLAIFSCTPEQMQEINFPDFFSAESQKKYETLLGGEQNRIELEIRDKKNQPKWLEIQSVESVWTKQPARLDFVNEITARKQAEMYLKQSNEELELKVKERTDEISQLNEELATAIEELTASNEKLSRKIREQERTQHELDAYKTKLETLVEQRTAALSESEAKFRLISEQSLMAIGIIQDGKIKYVNQAFCQMTGYSIQEIYSMQPGEFGKIIYEEDRDFAVEQATKKERGEKDIVTNYEFRWLHKNGTPFWVEVYSKTVNYLGKTADLFTFIDIDERKRGEIALKQSEKKFRNIFDNSNDGIAIVDFEYNFLDINRTICNISGFSRNDFLQKNALDMLVRPTADVFRARTEALKKRGSQKAESEFLLRNGRVIPVEISSRVIEFDSGKAILANLRDISERKHAERKVFNAVIETEERERRRFAEELHDGLGPLLSSIKMYVKFWAEKAPESGSNEIIDNLYEVIDEAIVSLKDISHKLSPSVLQDFGLKVAVKSFCDRMAKSKDIDFEIEIGKIPDNLDSKVEITAYRIITELTNNTLKHAKASRATINLFSENRKLYIKYADNGQGFEMGKTENSSGKGLGLSNIRSRAASLGGSFELQSTPPNGMKAKIQLKL